MSENESNRTGVTKLGFTKVGFGCCSHFNYCQMGKSNCFYEVKDPEVQKYCSAFLRNHKGKTEGVENNRVINIEHEVSDLELIQNEEGQLSLF